MKGSTELKVALLQTELVWENPNANLEMLSSKLESLADKVDLVALPEMFTTGFTMNAAGVAEEVSGPSIRKLLAFSENAGLAICGSLVVVEEGKYYNRFFWIERGKLVSTYDKRHLFRMAEEHHIFSPGLSDKRINFKGWHIMPRVCYDLRFPVWSRSNEVDLQIYVANWPAPRVAAWDKLLMARAIENQCYVIGVNRIGEDGKGIPYVGHSIVIDPKGNALTLENEERAGWIYASLDLDELNEFREKFPLALDADYFEIKP
jgi:predicted amidohydrolase